MNTTKLPTIYENSVDTDTNKKKTLNKLNEISIIIDKKNFKFINEYDNNNNERIKIFVNKFKQKIENKLGNEESFEIILKKPNEEINEYKSILLLVSPLDYQLILILNIINNKNIKKNIVNYLKNNFFNSIINLITKNYNHYDYLITNNIDFNIKKIISKIIIITSLKINSFYLLLINNTIINTIVNTNDKQLHFKKIYNLLTELDNGAINIHINKFINNAFCDDNISQFLLDNIKTIDNRSVTRSLSNKNRKECDKLKNTIIYATIDAFYKQIIIKFNNIFDDDKNLLLNELDDICLNKSKKDIYKYIKEIITFYLFFNAFDEDDFYSINKELHKKTLLLLFYDNLTDYTEWLIQQNNKKCYTYIKIIYEIHDDDKFKDYDDNSVKLPLLSKNNTNTNKTIKAGKKRKQIKTKKHYNKTK
jgi:hypothetical protein